MAHLSTLVLGAVVLLVALTLLFSVVTLQNVQIKLNDNKLSPKIRYSKQRVAFAVTVTKDGKYMDGAIVLKHSIDMQDSLWDVSFVAIVHPNVTTTRSALEKIGWTIREFTVPIKSSEIHGKELRETIDKTGCCGAAELLKLRAYQLTEFDRVVLLDMDTLLLKNLDELLESDKEAQFTYDHAMDSPGSSAPPMQGGFMIIRPSQAAYKRLVDVVREGDFRPGTGWGGSRIGWCWGGQTIQGLISYYYNLVDRDNKVILDNCVHDAMVSTKNCRDTDIKDIYSIHYTVCQKPWDCRPSDKPLCVKMVAEWWKVRQDYEEINGFARSNGPCKRSREYSQVPY